MTSRTETSHTLTVMMNLIKVLSAHRCQLRSSFLNSVPSSGSRIDRAVRSKHRAASTARLCSGQPLSLPNTSQTECYTSTHTQSLLVIILATCVIWASTTKGTTKVSWTKGLISKYLFTPKISDWLINQLQPYAVHRLIKATSFLIWLNANP